MLGAFLTLALGSCTEDGDDSDQRVHELRLTLGSSSFTDDCSATRASGDLPTAFEAYHHGSLQQILQIQCYMTYEKDGAQKYIPCLFNHETSTTEPGHEWTSKVPLYTLTDENAKYYLYGFMPKEDVGSSVTLEPYDDDTSTGAPASFARGVKMTLTGLNAVTPNDICVIVGAKGYGSDGNTAVPDMSDRLGRFDYYPDTDGNNLFLLIDHIYAGLKFNMKLDPNYSNLRGIKVKSIKLIPENSNNEVIETVDAVVTIVANTNNQNPIVPKENSAGENISGSVVFPTDKFKKGKAPKPAVIYEGDGKALSTTNQEFMACLCPATNKNFTLETKYDVYDRKGNLIREGETARNAIRLERDLTSGEIHTVNITVKPTFLYMLSEPDLDNPTFSVGS